MSPCSWQPLSWFLSCTFSAHCLSPFSFQPAFPSMGRCRSWCCGVLCHPALSPLRGAGVEWGPCLAALNGPIKTPCPEKQRWVSTESWTGTNGYAESCHAIKYTGVCPLVHPGKSRPGQGKAGWLEKPHLSFYIPVLSCTPWSATCRKLLFIVRTRNIHFCH